MHVTFVFDKCNMCLMYFMYVVAFSLVVLYLMYMLIYLFATGQLPAATYSAAGARATGGGLDHTKKKLRGNYICVIRFQQRHTRQVAPGPPAAGQGNKNTMDSLTS